MRLAGLPEVEPSGVEAPRVETPRASPLGHDLAHLATHPEDAACLARIGRAFFDMKRYRSAAAYLEAAAALMPGTIDPLLGHAWLEAGEHSRAEAVYRSLLDHSPDHLDALGGMGNSRLRRKDRRGALDHYRRLDALMPDQGALLQTMGKCHAVLLELEEAGECFAKALALTPDDRLLRAELAWLRYEQGQNAEAERIFQEGLARSQDADTRYGYGFLLLHLGRWEEGFPLYEERWNTAALGPRYHRVTDPIGSPGWDGQTPLYGKTVMAVVEQGGGDLIQFARFCYELQAMGATVDLLSTESLAPILRSMPWIRQVHIRYQDIPPHDFHVKLMSCPYFFGLTPETIPHHPPYLTAPAERPRFNDRPTVGLVWQGDPTYPYDHYRSLRFEHYRELIERHPDYRFVSLQFENADALAAEWITEGRLIDGAAEIKNYADTAAALNAIDLLISPDTSIAHLAGAMGRPTCLMLSAKPDWRWFGQESRTPWYGSHSLWRQDRLGDWQGVLGRLGDSLPGLLG